MVNNTTSRRLNLQNFDDSPKPSGRFWKNAAYHEQPSVTLERLARLEDIMVSEIEAIKKLLK